MDVDSVGPDVGAPAVARPTVEGAQVPDVTMAVAIPVGECQREANAEAAGPNLGLLQGQQLNGQSPHPDQLHAQRATPAPDQQLQCLPADIPAVSPSNATLQNTSPGAPPVHTDPPAVAPLSRGPAPSDVPGHSPQAAAAASHLNALSSLLALTSASKPASTSRLTRAEVLQRAKAMRQDLERARERARVELWETTVEGACWVGLGKELAKGGGGAGR